MIYIAASGLLLLVMISYLVYVSNIRFFIKLVCFPVLVSMFYLIGAHYVDNLGAPQFRKIPEEFDYRHHMVMNDDTILVWLKVDDKERLIRVVYERELAKALEEAKDMQEEGGSPQVEGNTEIDDNSSNERPWRVEDAVPTDAITETK